MLIDAPPTLLNTIIHKKHLSHFMAKTMNELAHMSPLISFFYPFIFLSFSFSFFFFLSVYMSWKPAISLVKS